MKATSSDRQEHIEALAFNFVDAWSSAQVNDPLVIEGGMDALETPRVKEYEAKLKAEGYNMEYDAEEECFCLVPDDGVGIFEGTVAFYY